MTKLKEGKKGILWMSVIIVVAGFLMLFLPSCSTLNHAIKKNYRKTERIAMSLFRENGNVFFVTSTYANLSVVWTYDEERVEIYRLREGKTRHKQVLRRKEALQFEGLSLEVFEEIEKEIYQKCALELDGDLLGFIIEVDGKANKETFAVDINCLKRGHYDSGLLDGIVNDINDNRMWDFKYQ